VPTDLKGTFTVVIDYKTDPIPVKLVKKKLVID
jgi:hypothetical protein